MTWELAFLLVYKFDMVASSIHVSKQTERKKKKEKLKKERAEEGEHWSVES